MSDSDVITFDTESWMKEAIRVEPTFTIYNLVKNTDPILTKPIIDFDFTNPPINPNTLASNLVETCKKYNGIGLSANQCGLPYKVFVIGANNEYVAFFNPKIISISETMVKMEEGCLSFPNLFLNITRPDSLTVEYQDFNGIPRTTTLTGLTARCFLHELDHMSGIVYTSKVGPVSLQMAEKKRKKYERLAARLRTGLSKIS